MYWEIWGKRGIIKENISIVPNHYFPHFSQFVSTLFIELI